ncbi:putative guanylate cyclase [Trypanosoma rangeli]|uniref:Putative guanylate cyclase n=1 Tax=Trypanosoma rangeli TaxID=5698 RepID=A0A3R7KDM9_TRYRA|nr:putative guanylate cyclase [Trypanosoma rangeli]RNF05952.1 putative guanylate cyclase [Trypanosoma rangeli]|eukprot:RNF05952.1 putative guanylate cyclase [Trypanosoma rangeli]
MIVSQRITALRRVEMQLRRLVREEAIRHSTSSLHSVVDVKLREGLRRSAGVKDKLLFRQVPVALSLLERSLIPVVRRKRSTAEKAVERHEAQSSTTGSTEIVPPPSQSCDDVGVALSGSGKAVAERGTTFAASTALSSRGRVLRRPEYTLSLLSSLHFVEQERRKLYRHHMDRLESKLQKAEQALHILQKRRDATFALKAAREAVTNAKADILLLQSSLLSRPYISARLWRFLLCEDVWVAAVRDSGQRHDNSSASTAPSVVMMLLSLARLSFGALRDVFRGRVLNARAPRFVASLPSRRMRRRNVARVGLKDEKGSTTPGSMKEPVSLNLDNHDTMMAMMMEMMWKNGAEEPSLPSAPQETVEATVYETNSKADLTTTIPQLRWLPPSSSDVVPLVLETLAMCSHVLPLLNTTAIVSRCGEVHELFELLSVLQATASSLLALRTYERPGEIIMHQTLRRLEDAMLNCGEEAKCALLAQLAGGASLGIPPVKAGRLLLGLESMKLLQTEEYASQQLLLKLVVCVFPQLSTGTQRALLEKSRQNSLFAFATRGQRIKLYYEHGKHGMESALLNSVRTRARLQQRQIQAALRIKHLDEVNSRSVGQLADELPAHSLMTLFDLLVRAARDTKRQGIEVQGCFITAALFVVESIWVAGARASSSSCDTMLQPSDLPGLLLTLSILWPLVTERYQMTRNTPSDQLDSLKHRSRPHRYHNQQRREVSDSVAKSELIMVTYVTDTVFSAVSAAIAERVERAESVAVPKSGKESAHVLSLKDIMCIADALFEWANISSTNRNATSLETTSRLMKRLLVADIQLWEELRELSELQREQFMRRLSNVFRCLNMLDATVTQALSSVC